MKENVHFVNTAGEEVVPVIEKNGKTHWIYKAKNAVAALALSSVFLASCGTDGTKSAQTAKLKAQLERSENLDMAKKKLADERKDVAEAEEELVAAQEAYDESINE